MNNQKPQPSWTPFKTIWLGNCPEPWGWGEYTVLGMHVVAAVVLIVFFISRVWQ